VRREIVVTEKQLDLLRRLSDSCYSMVVVDGEGMFSGFDDERWREGLAEILGDAAPPDDGHPTYVVVVRCATEEGR
jgi:hypothetical protein